MSRKLELEDTDATAYLRVYFVLTQQALLGLVYAFTRVDRTTCFSTENAVGCSNHPNTPVPVA